MTGDTVVGVTTVALVAASGPALLWWGTRAGARRTRYQVGALGLAVAVWGCVRLLGAPGRPVGLVGDLGAPVRGLSWLGIADGDSWLSVLLGTGSVVVAVTAVTVWLQTGRGRGVTAAALVGALPAAAGLAAANATAEELLFRVALVQGVPAALLAVTTTAAVSGVLFGVPHLFGHPGGVVGAALATVLGWLSCTATLQTGGIAWAWLLHVVLDVVILVVVLAVADAAPRAVSSRRRGSSAP